MNPRNITTAKQNIDSIWANRVYQGAEGTLELMEKHIAQVFEAKEIEFCERLEIACVCYYRLLRYFPKNKKAQEYIKSFAPL